MRTTWEELAGKQCPHGCSSARAPHCDRRDGGNPRHEQHGQ
jgi:hypothetical protein